MAEESKRRNTITVLLSDRDYELYDAYCEQHGYKKSTLIARLVKEHLAKENFSIQQLLLEEGGEENAQTENK